MNRSGRTFNDRERGRASVWILVASVCAVVAIAAVCAYVLQRSTHLDWANRDSTHITLSPVDVAFIAVIMGGVWALIGRLGWALALVTGFVVLVAGINRNKVELRHEPLFPGDRSFVSTPSFFLSMVDPGAVVTLLLSVVLAIVAIVAVRKIAGRRHRGPRIRHANGGLNARVFGLRLAALVLSAGLLLHAVSFNEPRNLWRALYDIDAEWTPWSQLHNYRANGFVGGFLYNMPITAMKEPGGYGRETMSLLSERYAQRAAQINAGRQGSIEDFNVVFVLSESFTDPSWLDGFTLAENPIPATQQIMSETLAGQMYAHSYGGGTSTMEFESLTGQSVGLFRPQVTSPYQMFVTDRPGYPSAVGAFAELGHHTTAIHAYNLHLYKRPQVYRTFGFDVVVNDVAMQSQTRLENSRFISDEASFAEVLHHLDRRDGPAFIHLATMQNHGPHHDSYTDPIEVHFDNPDKAKEIGHYARGLAHSDAAMTDFLGALQERERPTIVVFYGDHHPGIYGDTIVAGNKRDALLRTPFFVWNSQSNEAQLVPAIGPAMFLPLVYEAADARVPPYVALLDDVRRSIPVIQHGRALNADGEPVDPSQLDEPARALIDDLRLVQYDFSVGERYAVDTMWPGAVVRDR